ncbi:MAG: hypothetical protein J6B77_02275 [Clostridia bacterium]|nr:hypothetical protein [Clostridia bacterium]
MKKATLLTFLFAVLMIALLVSCNTSPDPLPSGGGETTTDAAGGEVTTAEITTESDMTTDEPPVTTDCEIVVAPNMNETLVLPEGETPWYITEWTENPRWKTDLAGWSGYTPVPEEKQDLAFQVPLTFEGESDGIVLKAEFFQKGYRMGELMQVRFSITNTRDTAFTFLSNLGAPMEILRTDADGEVRRDGCNVYAMADDFLTEDEHYTWGYYMELIMRYLTIPKGETLVLEYAYHIDPTFYDLDSSYCMAFEMKEGTDGNYSYEPGHPFVENKTLHFGCALARMVRLSAEKS